jgi:hypothetical protein
MSYGAKARVLGRDEMTEKASFADFPVEIRKRAANYLSLTSQSGIPEASRIGSEGTENSENTERSEGKEGTEGSETSERSETTETSETSENTERKESMERSSGLFRGPR